MLSPMVAEHKHISCGVKLFDRFLMLRPLPHQTLMKKKRHFLYMRTAIM